MTAQREPLYQIFCIYSLPGLPEARTFFGVVSDNLLARIFIHFLAELTPKDFPKLGRLSACRFGFAPAEAIALRDSQTYADETMGNAFMWLGKDLPEAATLLVKKPLPQQDYATTMALAAVAFTLGLGCWLRR